MKKILNSFKNIKFKKANPVFVIIGIVLFLYCLSLVFTLFWALMASLKTRSAFAISAISFPKFSEMQFQNYATVFEFFYVTVGKGSAERDVYMLEMFLYSVLYAGGSSICLVFTTSTVAYCCARFKKFKVAGVYTAVVIFTMAMPAVGGQAAELEMLLRIGLYDSMIGMWIMKLYFGGVYYLVFLATYASISKDYSDAAYIDGANNYTIYFRLMMPLVSKTLATVLLIDVIAFWNDYQTPLLYMPSSPTLAYGLYMFSITNKNQKLSSVPMRMAGCMVLFIPIFIVFIAFQKQLIGNVAVGGLKE